MLNEVIEYLNIKPGAKIIDATLDGGGHTFGLLEKLPSVKIIGIEWDPGIVENLKLKIKNDPFDETQGHPEQSRTDEKLKELESSLIIVNASYTNIKKITEEYDFRPDGILFDLGVSSWHYERSGRGFSFLRNEPLDMRFNPQIVERTAADIVNIASRNELEDILTKYGEEKFASEIAKGIIDRSKINPINSTDEFVDVVLKTTPTRYKKRKIHPATKTFQALRITVNDELENMEKGILAAINVLTDGGRLIVISFQGLEDKIVREIFKQKAKEGIIQWVIKGTVKPKWEEVKQNPRARSAKMKIVEKV